VAAAIECLELGRWKSMKFRLVTYNIHKGIGGIDRRYRPERIVETLAHQEPDVVMMQEVDEGVPRSRFDRQVELFADALGLHHFAFQPNVRLKRGHYGNAILSRFSLTEIEHIELKVPLKKRRRGLVARCSLPLEEGHHRSLVLANLHLGLAGYERRIQIRRVLESHCITHLHQQTPLIIGGDFNDASGALGKRILIPAGFTSSSVRTRTFPAMLATRALDYVFYRGDLDASHSFASRSKVARRASDHLPLVVDFHLRA